MDFRKTFDQIPERFDKYRPRYCEELYQELTTSCGLNPDNITLEEPYKSDFYAGIRKAIMDAGNQIIIIDTVPLYLVQKPFPHL